MCLADAVRGGEAARAYLVLGGDGWTLRDYFTSGALKAFGLLGIVLGPVVFAIAGAVIEMLGDDRALADQEIPPDRR